MKKNLLSCFIIFFSILSACSPEPEVPVFAPEPYLLELPHYFPYLKIPEDNPMTKEGVELGRHLYYDPMLSKDGDRSCGSCHEQKAGFAKPGTNVLPHVNLAWNMNFLWNGKIQGSLEDAMLFEVTDFFESNPEKFKQSHEYVEMFKKAYNIEDITHKDLAYALAQFFRSMVSANSPYDQFLLNKTVLSPAELNGMELFFSEKGDCFHCHGAPLFTDNQFHNIGLERGREDEQQGLFEITRYPPDKGKFKTPTLRNASLRKSFMHDGRFKTLEEVVAHYNSGIQHSPTLDPLMYKNREDFQLGLTEQETKDLVAFLKTLTDQEYINNPSLSNPF